MHVDVHIAGGTGVLDLTSYRSAVADLVAALPQLDEDRATGGATRAYEAMLRRLLAEPQILAVLAATPHGEATVDRLLSEVRTFVRNDRSSATRLSALVRIFLLAQIETVWWGAVPAFQTDAETERSSTLVDLEALAGAGRLGFSYRRQAGSVTTRALRAVERRVAPHRRPRTAGLRFARTRPEVATLLNQLAAAMAPAVPAATPRLFVTSLARSVTHQQRLRALGYAAIMPSAHCTGYAADVEVAWYRRFGAHEALQEVLLDRQRRGDINVIDEGQAWHICVSPAAAQRLGTDAGRLG